MFAIMFIADGMPFCHLEVQPTQNHQLPCAGVPSSTAELRELLARPRNRWFVAAHFRQPASTHSTVPAASPVIQPVCLHVACRHSGLSAVLPSNASPP